MNGLAEDSVSLYFDLNKSRPDLFKQSNALPLVLDEEKMRDFAKTTGKRMGFVHDQSPYWLVLADLCEGANGQLYSYGRVVYCNEESNGAAALIKCEDKFGLIKAFRHGPRTVSVEIPRGFNEEKGLSPEENIAKEISEELGIAPETCRIQKLGEKIRPDAGLTSGSVSIFLAEIMDGTDVRTTGEEGVLGFDWYTEEQFLEAVRNGDITDGFTLSAYALYASNKETHII